VAALLNAAKYAPNPRRDEAILLLLLDTGLRAAELCNMKMKDVDFQSRSAKVLGKGNKLRMCYWSVGTAKALSRYLRYEKRHPEDPVFCSDRGTLAGEALTPSGLYQIVSKLGDKAGVKCGCHDWRRTFAVSMLRNGANLISVQRLMGHETLSITQGYLNLAEADIENQHREFSPVARLRKSNT
jgi:site-specific recombinase XerD